MKFRTAVAKAYGVNPKQIEVRPQQLGIPHDHFASRGQSELFAFRADFQDRGFIVYGCNTAAPGDPAFIKHPDGIAALMKAARVLEEKNSLPAADLALLVAWIYHDYGAPIDPSAAKLERTRDGAVLSYKARFGREEKSAGTRLVTAKVQSNYATKVSSVIIDTKGSNARDLQLP